MAVGLAKCFGESGLEFGAFSKRFTSSHVFLRGVGLVPIFAFVVVRSFSGGLHFKSDLIPAVKRIDAVDFDQLIHMVGVAVLIVENLEKRLLGGNLGILIRVSFDKPVLQNSNSETELTINSEPVMKLSFLAPN